MIPEPCNTLKFLYARWSTFSGRFHTVSFTMQSHDQNSTSSLNFVWSHSLFWKIIMWWYTFVLLTHHYALFFLLEQPERATAHWLLTFRNIIMKVHLYRWCKMYIEQKTSSYKWFVEIFFYTRIYKLRYHFKSLYKWYSVCSYIHSWLRNHWIPRWKLCVLSCFMWLDWYVC